jgi:recombination protein RecR
MNFSSKVIENAVNELSKFPGIGKKTALRMVVHLVKTDEINVNKLSDSIIKLRQNLRKCSICANISESEVCQICASSSRNQAIVCVVKDFQDIMAIENTAQYNGVYHVLGGLISPMDGIGPDEINIDLLEKRVSTGKIEELIMALSATLEGDTTVFYISRKLSTYHIKLSAISRGISVGGELEFADEITLGRSITSRIPYSDK